MEENEEKISFKIINEKPKNETEKKERKEKKT